MKILIIGFGSIGKRHAQILSAHNSVKEICVLSNQLNLPYHTFKKIDQTKEYNPDYIVVCSETSKHLEHLSFIEKNFKNKLVLIEKPLFSKYYKFNIKNNKVFVGYNLRYHPLLNLIKKKIHNKKIWSVQIICGSFLPSWRKNIDYRISYSAKSNGGGVLLDLSHELDYAVWLFGNLKPNFVVSKKISNLKIESDDYLSLFLANKQQTYIQISLNYFMKKPTRKIFIDGEDISIQTDLINNTSFVFEKDQHNIEKLDNFNRNKMYEEQHDDVINHKFDKISSFTEANSLMKLIDKIKENKI